MLPSGKLHLQFIEVFLQLAVQIPDFQSILWPLYHTQGHGPPWVLHDRFIPFWGKWPKNPSYRLELQPFRVEVDHPFQWPHFADNNSQHLCNALGQGQTRRCQWGPVRPPRRLKARLPGGDGMEPECPGLSLTRACDEEPQTIATMHSAPLVFPNLLVFQELEIWIFLKMGNLFFKVGVKWYDIIVFKTLHRPNKTHLWPRQSIWASSLHTLF